MRYFLEFFAADIFECFAARVKMLVYLDGFLGHFLVRFLRTADESEVGAGGNSLVAVGVKTNPEQYRASFSTAFGLRHGLNLRFFRWYSKPKVRQKNLCYVDASSCFPLSTPR